MDREPARPQSDATVFAERQPRPVRSTDAGLGSNRRKSAIMDPLFQQIALARLPKLHGCDILCIACDPNPISPFASQGCDGPPALTVTVDYRMLELLPFPPKKTASAAKSILLQVISLLFFLFFFFFSFPLSLDRMPGPGVTGAVLN